MYSYTTPSTVKEVSAMFVATIIRLQFEGGGLNTRTCRVKNTNIKQKRYLHIECMSTSKKGEKPIRTKALACISGGKEP